VLLFVRLCAMGHVLSTTCTKMSLLIKWQHGCEPLPRPLVAPESVNIYQHRLVSSALCDSKVQLLWATAV